MTKMMHSFGLIFLLFGMSHAFYPFFMGPNLNAVRASKYIVTKTFKGIPKRSDFEIVEEQLPPLKDNEILTKAEYISVDPYMRAFNAYIPVPYDQTGAQVAIVQQSKNSQYPVGTRVVTQKGWSDYSIVDPSIPENGVQMIPNIPGVSPSLSLGVLGLTGVTAYFGLLDICKPKPGETVVVSGAAGAVGSAAGQLAKIMGCKVIGFAGTDEKTKWLVNDLGFDKALNYKKVNIDQALKEAAPNGVDCYFDNVGGELSSSVMYQMNTFGRVAVAGSISAYNENPAKRPKVSIVQPAIIGKQLKIEGFESLSKYRSRWPEAISDLSKWIVSGQLKVREHVTVGFDKVYDAFIGMLKGENTGKAIVKV